MVPTEFGILAYKSHIISPSHHMFSLLIRNITKKATFHGIFVVGILLSRSKKSGENGKQFFR